MSEVLTGEILPPEKPAVNPSQADPANQTDSFAADPNVIEAFETGTYGSEMRTVAGAAGYRADGEARFTHIEPDFVAEPAGAFHITPDVVAGPGSSEQMAPTHEAQIATVATHAGSVAVIHSDFV